MRRENKKTQYKCPKCGAIVLNTLDYYVDFYQCSNENCLQIFVSENELKEQP
jgi:DNA-directed RNA polymerase subunit RPC12/RpoP